MTSTSSVRCVGGGGGGGEVHVRALFPGRDCGVTDEVAILFNLFCMQSADLQGCTAPHVKALR